VLAEPQHRGAEHAGRRLQATEDEQLDGAIASAKVIGPTSIRAAQDGVDHVPRGPSALRRPMNWPIHPASFMIDSCAPCSCR